MGRSVKQGLDYFPLDVNFLKDLKVRRIMKASACSPTILLSLLSNIYREYGYFVEWNEDMPFLIADELIGVSEGAVSEVIIKALQVNFFNNELYSKYKILTSKEIQETFLKITERRKRVEIVSEYLLADNSRINANIYFISVCNNQINVDINPINADINPVNVCINQQSKVKESKVKENKKEIVPTGVGTPPEKQTKQFSHDSIEYKSSKYLADKILEKNPNASRVPKTDENLYKWCVHIDYLLRIDKKPVDEFRKVLAFAVKDAFWSTNILSTSKLREKYDTLFMQMNTGKDDNIGIDKGNTNANAPAKPNRFANIKYKDAGTGEDI